MKKTLKIILIIILELNLFLTGVGIGKEIETLKIIWMYVLAILSLITILALFFKKEEGEEI